MNLTISGFQTKQDKATDFSSQVKNACSLLNT